MRFHVSRGAVAGVETLSLEDAETGAACLLLPELGATVWRLSLAACDPGGAAVPRVAAAPGAAAVPGAAEVLAADTPGEMAANPWFRGRILFPFNDRIPGGRYRFEGRDYRLAVNDPDSDCALHGLVYDRAFDVDGVEEDEARAVAALSRELKPGDAPGYPFRVRLCVRAVLATDGFTLELTAQNTGDRTAPVAMGWHPYIALAGGVDAARLSCAAERSVAVDDDLMPTGERPPVAGGPLDFTEPRSLTGRELDIALERPGRGIPPAGRRTPEVVGALVDRGSDRIRLEQSTEPFRFTQLFIPPARDSIAVEPVTAATDAFNRPELGLRRLEPGAEIRGTIRIRRYV